MNDLASLTGQPVRRTIGGRTLALHPLTLADFGALQAWVDRQTPDPFDLINAQIAAGRATVDDSGRAVRVPYTTAQQQYFFRLALEQQARGRKLLGTPDADGVVQSVAGVKELLLLSVRKGDPAFSDADAAAVFDSMTVSDLGQLFHATGADAVLSDPKAGGPPATGPGPTT